MGTFIKVLLLIGAVVGIFYIPFFVPWPWNFIIVPSLGYAAGDLAGDLAHPISWN